MDKEPNPTTTDTISLVPVQPSDAPDLASLHTASSLPIRPVLQNLMLLTREPDGPHHQTLMHKSILPLDGPPPTQS